MSNVGAARASGTRRKPQVEINGQVTGYWVRDLAEAHHQPPYDATGALLLDGKTSSDSEAVEALTLMKIDGRWRPISHAATLTYIHTTALADGDPMYFVIFDDSGRRKVYSSEPRLLARASA